ncbi:hypothetical protein [Haladaptatus caseinilyticus]|nr:hypothetical protein [Haladaptatus caseinilyticus]
MNSVEIVVQRKSLLLAATNGVDKDHADAIMAKVVAHKDPILDRR